uniref:ATP synthase F0 subunit 6 n=1 Tax=Fundulus catenatus TaxID=34776 RepID=UPI002A82CA8F|nr:ATP synthase F0 subunit 6 [Fundulus catenatus]WNX94366.1 ATP synthase F0 subunit 6 [Fundulus catenatus]
MTVTLFDQFMSPTLFKISLITIALIFPWLLHYVNPTRFSSERFLNIKKVFASSLSKHIFLPIGTQGHKWALLFVSLFVFLITLNTLGLLPYTFTPTTQFSLTLALAFPLWLATVIIALRLHLTRTMGHFVPRGAHAYLVPFLAMVETISFFMRPPALALRLMANLTAGHLMISLISSGALLLTSILPAAATLTLILLGLLTILEIMVAFIQAYVFVLLLSLYLSDSL